MRTIIEVPQLQLDALDVICRTEGISRAEAIRRAITRMVGETRHALVSPAFGLWRDRPVDGLGLRAPAPRRVGGRAAQNPTAYAARR